MTSIAMNRRTLLAAGAGGSAALLGGGALAGCSNRSGSPQNAPSVNEAVIRPAYVPYRGVQPDLPGNEAGVDPAFRNFPREHPKVVQEKPGSGQPLTGMGNIFYAVPPGPDQNTYWAGLNDRLGVDLKLQMVPTGDWSRKFATTIAGNELPDLMQMRVIANFPQLLDKKFARLDDHLAGDAVKNYPNLANLPEASWQAAIYNGGIYGVPIPRGASGNYCFVRQDLFEQAGVSMEPKGFDELKELMRALTDPPKRRWAIGSWAQLRKHLITLNEAPNGWRYEGGKLTHQYETEEYKQTINDLIELWQLGVIHPDTFSDSLQSKALFSSGSIAITHDGYLGWTQYVLDNVSNPAFKLGLIPVYTRDGSELAPWHQGNASFSITSLKKQDSPDKLTLALRVLNWLAAPFGTEEYLYRLYGEQGVDHTVNAEGNPTLTKTGQTNTVLPIRYLADAPPVIYQPGRPDDADQQHAYQTKILATSVADPTDGLFSNTLATQNATVDRNVTDGLKAIIQGRKPFAEWDRLIDTWRQQAGDKIRAEYEDQLQ
ncbi:extracellular solute-binding protein [Microlunatus speluncae]|uniref:extracellular solute-binding protein n=1 Tax=Microlunatus speluncae TaxID=2594267 RepID=UPI0012667D49|nr:extracellular solute-binding protein [Microlunatus speluncae]